MAQGSTGNKPSSREVSNLFVMPLSRIIALKPEKISSYESTSQISVMPINFVDELQSSA